VEEPKYLFYKRKNRRLQRKMFKPP